MTKEKSCQSNRRKPSKPDANSRVSNQWTDLLIQEVQMLGDSPRNNYLKSQFLSKYVSKDTDPAEARRQRAISKWLATERDNEATNDRLLTYSEDYNILPRVKFNRFVAFTQSVIADILGDVVPLEALYGSFSGGATTSKLRTESHPASKYLGQADITSAAIPWFELALDHLEGWDAYRQDLFGYSPLRIVPGNVLFTVPKTTTIDRCACKEPDLNMFLQKGAGDFMRRRLKQIGIDLNDQSRNKDLAREGSLTGVLATLDLSSASDSVSAGFVELMVPVCWFTFLNAIRSPVTVIDGEEHVNQMFSSMGNGFTFELESLLFYALARATAFFTGTRGVISVYGDDIIVPSEMAQDLSWVLGVFGFSVNPDKSFHSGSFRESCGGHYHHGVDITPFYLKGPITRLTDLIHAANSVRKWSGLDGCSVLSPELEELWVLMRDEVPKRFWGGHDVGNKMQLVTDSKPSHTLVPITLVKTTGVGGYLHWLNAVSDRKSLCEAVETSSTANTATRYRERKVRAYGDRRRVSQVYSCEV